METQTNTRLDQIAADVALLVERQRRIDDFMTEMTPIFKDMMGVGITRMQDAETAGYFRAAKAAAGALDRVVRGHSAEELDELGDDLVRILDTLRVLTRPDVLQVAADAATVVEHREDLAPLGLVGMVRAGGDVDVQRGMAVMMELLKHVGRAAGSLGTAPPARRLARKALPAGRSTHPGLEALAPKRRPPAAACEVPSTPGKAVTQLDGVGFTAEGFVAEPAKWTPTLGETIAAQAGIPLTDAHWALVNFARKEWLETSVSPNIRRLSLGTGTSTKDIYTLFKKAPGKTIARIAGVPKPAGCL